MDNKSYKISKCDLGIWINNLDEDGQVDKNSVIYIPNDEIAKLHAELENIMNEKINSETNIENFKQEYESTWSESLNYDSE